METSLLKMGVYECLYHCAILCENEVSHLLTVLFLHTHKKYIWQLNFITHILTFRVALKFRIV